MDCQDWYAELTAHHLVTGRPSHFEYNLNTAAMGFSLRDKITGGYPIKMKFTTGFIVK